MKYLFTLFLNISCASVLAQDFSATVSAIDAGTNLLNKRPVKATQISFPVSIYQYEIDTARNELFVTLRKAKGDNYKNEGALALIDLNTDQVKWSKKMRYFNTISTKNCYQTMTPEKIYCHAKANDALLWERPADIQYILPEQYVAYTGTQRLVRINEKNGEVMWKKKRKINTGVGMDEMQFLNDSTILFAEDGLHTVNINTGGGWDYQLKTGSSNDAGMLATSFILGGLIGAAIYSAAATPVNRTGMSSGIMVDSSIIYYASSTELTCLDTKGKFKWMVPFENHKLGSSMLLNRQDRVILLDLGFANKDNDKVRVGWPFIAAYNKKTGTEIYHTSFDTRHYVQSYTLSNDTLLLAFSDSLVTYNIANGAGIASMANRAKDTEPFTKILNIEDYYIKNANGTFAKMDSLCAGCYLVESETKVALIFPNLASRQILSGSDLWETTYTNDRYQFLQNHTSDNAAVLQNGKRIADIMLDKDAIYYQNKICYIKDDRFVIVDMAGIE